jgi:uncharacterized protein YcfJ
MHIPFKPLLGLAFVAFAAHATAQVTFYEDAGFRGRTFQTNRAVENMSRFGFNDRASSVVVEGGRWEVCEDVRFGGRCVMLRRGSYDSLSGLGLQDRISSVRPVDNRRQIAEAPEPLPAPTYDYRRRPNERVSEVPVTSVRAVLGPPEQRCWIERQAAPGQTESRGYNVPGAVIGGVLGGILGHQIGGGTGNTVATIGGVAGGAAIGANVNRPDAVTDTRNVRRCDNTAQNAAPQYYDVTYNFRGVEHRVQMAQPPGRTLTVNANGEPRG